MSIFNFAPDQNQRSAIELIPHGTSLLCVVTPESVSRSQNSGGVIARLCFTVARGPYERRKMRMYVGDPNDENNSEKYRQMSLATLQHMLESCGIFDPDKPETYQRYASVKPEDVFLIIIGDLDGKYVAVKAKTEKGGDGYDDKSVPGTILSPNPNGRTAKAYEEVKNGADTHVAKPAAPGFGQPAQGGFGGFGSTTGAAASSAPSSASPSQQEHPQSSAPEWLSSNGG